MGSQFDNRDKTGLKNDPNKADDKLDRAQMPDSDREQVRRQVKSVDTTKGGELLQKGIRDRSNDPGRDAPLDFSRTADRQMMAMISTVFPELSTSASPQRDAFIKAFENPALIRSYLINPKETAASLAKGFPDLQDMILKNMPFTQSGSTLEVNPKSGLYQRVLAEVDGKEKVGASFVRNEMDKLLLSPTGMDTKAYDLIRNHIESNGQFTKKGAGLVADISRLMQSGRAKEDLKEAQALGAKSPLAGANATTFVSATLPPSSGAVPVQGGGSVDASTLKPVPPPQMAPPNQSKGVEQSKGIPLQGGGAVDPAGLKVVPPQMATPTPAKGADQSKGIPLQGGGAVDPAGLKVVPPPTSPQQGTQLTGPPPSTTIPGQPNTAPPAAPAQAVPAAGAPAATALVSAPAAPTIATGAGTTATPTPPTGTQPAPATPTPAPAIKESPEVVALKERIAQLEAQAAKPAATPVAPAPSEEMKQVVQQNKDLNDRMSKMEKLLEQTVQKNAELDKKAAESEKKVADLEKKAAELEKKNEELEKRNEELEKNRAADLKAKPPEADKKDLSYEEIKDKAKALHDSMSGIGTDEALLLKTLSQLDKEGQKKVADFYSKTYNEDLDEAIESELSGGELEAAKKLREGAGPGTAEAVQIYNAVAGAGTDEAAIRSAFKGKTPEEAKAIAGEYQRLYGESLETSLRGDLSGAELDKTLKLLHSGEMEIAASKIYSAIDGAGTDEAEVMRTLAKFNAKQQEELAATYKRQYGTDLDKDLAGDFSGQELATVKKLRAGVAPGAAEAIELYHALDGWGTDEAVVSKAIKDKTPEQMSQIAAEYRALFNSSLDTDLKGDLSGQNLTDALSGLKGSTYDLHEMIESGKAANAEGYREARRLMRENPKTAEEYKSWYGKDPVEDLNSSPAVRSARIRREAAQKALKETEFLEDGAAPTPATPSSSTPQAAPFNSGGPTLQPDVTMNSMADLLNKDGSAAEIKTFLLANSKQLAVRSDEEIVDALLKVAPPELAKFNKSMREADAGFLETTPLYPDEVEQLERIARLAAPLKTD